MKIRQSNLIKASGGKASSGLKDRRQFLKTMAATAAGAMVTPQLAATAGIFSGSKQQRYPDPAVVVIDKRFEKYVVVNAAVERLWTGARWAEGPVWFGDGRYLLFSDIPDNTIYRWTEETGEMSRFRYPSNYTNGNTRDRQGRLVSCEHDSRRVTRTEHDGSITIIADSFQGKKLNAPNDVIVHSNGSIWFTDPGYGILSDYEGHVDEFELPANVYRIDPSGGGLTVVAEGFYRPNGLCFSPDEKILYIADTGQPENQPQTIKMFDVTDGERLTNKRIFCDTGKAGADGIRCDTDGNVWVGSSGGEGIDGVLVYAASDGKLIGKILLPEKCANLCFGGQKRNRLFMVASQSLYSLYVNAKGAMIP